ncbi:MAG: hypothetical protein GF315_01175 [candidate division Zixibacteria bacterium]|nr:hypothetical protein [candidate division Zixibacteria bacterium]
MANKRSSNSKKSTSNTRKAPKKNNTRSKIKPSDANDWSFYWNFNDDNPNHDDTKKTSGKGITWSYEGSFYFG